MHLDLAMLISRTAGEGTPAADAQAFAGEYAIDNVVAAATFAYGF
jgi:hypothetical protein